MIVLEKMGVLSGEFINVFEGYGRLDVFEEELDKMLLLG